MNDNGAGDVLWVGDVRLEILSPDRCWTGTAAVTANHNWPLSASKVTARICSGG
jgi:hypothetical protein